MELWKRLVGRWQFLVFNERFKDLSPKIYALRIMEEIFEIAQLEGVTEAEIDHIKRQVFSKPPDSTAHSEFGALLITLVGYALHRDINIEHEFYNEFCRIMDPKIMERVRFRNLQGDKIGMIEKE